MSYCPKCGNKVEETMVFCPHCGASLKAATYDQAAPNQPYQRRHEKAEKNEKQEKHQNQEKGEKNEKGERGFIGFLIGGLVLIVFGLFSLLSLSGYFNSGQDWAIMLLIIGVIIIAGAIYAVTASRRRFPQPPP